MTEKMPWFDFIAEPPRGLRVRYRNVFLTLREVQLHQRKDGTLGRVLYWVADDGRHCTSGMRANAVSWVR